MQVYSKNKHFYFLIFVLGITACSSTAEPEYTLPVKEDIYVKIYAELTLLTEQYSQLFDKQSYNDRKQAAHLILEKYGITYDQFKEQSDYYQKNAEQWINIYPKIVKYTEEIRREKLNRKKSNTPNRIQN